MNMHKKNIACLVALAGLCVFLIVGGSLSQTAGPGEDHYKRGMTLANQFECVQAIEEFDKAIMVNANDARYFTARAKCRSLEFGYLGSTAADRIVNERIVAEMEADLAIAIKLNASYAAAYYERGKLRVRGVAEQKGDPTPALRDFDKALELEPDNLEYLRERAHFLLIDLKNEQRGLNDMAVLIRREPNKPGHLFVRGRYFLEAERYPEAIRDLSAALRLDPKDRFARVLRAKAYFRSNDHTATLADLNILAKVLYNEVSFLDGFWVLETRAAIYRKQGKNALAAADERRLMRLKLEFEKDDPE